MANEPNKAAAGAPAPAIPAALAPAAPAAQPAAPAAPPAAPAPEPTKPVEPAVAKGPDKGKPGTPPKEGTLPVDATKRTKEEFDKLKNSNKQLFDSNQILQKELQGRSQNEQTFTPIQKTQPVAPADGQQAQSAQTKDIDVTKFVEIDPESGEKFINEVKLQTAVKGAQDRAIKAEQSVQNYIKQQQVRDDQDQRAEAFGSHPELDPQGDKFDADISRKTRSMLFDSMMNPQDYGGRQLRFKEAADRVKTEMTPPAAAAPADAEAAAKAAEEKTKAKQESQELKDQASLDASRSSGGANPPSEALKPEAEMGELQHKTRTGDMWALARRLINTPHTGTPTSSSKE